MKEDNKTILEEHLKVLQNAAKKDCSGEDLKAITEAMIMVLGLISKNESAETESEKIKTAFKEAQANQTVNIQFTGSLAQLAQILKPEIRKEDT